MQFMCEKFPEKFPLHLATPDLDCRPRLRRPRTPFVATVGAGLGIDIRGTLSSSGGGSEFLRRPLVALERECVCV